MSPVCEREELQRERVNTLQAAKVAGVCVRTIHYWVAQGRVDYVRTPTGQLRIFLDSLLRRHSNAA
jgi:predicted site-specific integrase-resolvase